MIILRCDDCGLEFPETECDVNGRCPDCHSDCLDDLSTFDDYDDSMDGDAASALASAGWGTDEDYGGTDERY